MEDKSRFLSQLDGFKTALGRHESGWKRVTRHVQKNFRAVAKELISELEYFYRLRKEQIVNEFQAASTGQVRPVYSESVHDIGAHLLRLKQVLNKAGRRKRRKFADGRGDIRLTKQGLKKIHDASYEKSSAPEKPNIRQEVHRHLRKLPAALERDSVVLKLFFILAHLEKKPPGYTSPGSLSEPYGKHVALFDAVLRWLFPNNRPVSKDRLIKYLRRLRKAFGSTVRRSHRLEFSSELLAVPWLKTSWANDKDLDSFVKAGVIRRSVATKLKKARTRKVVLRGKKLGEFLPPKPAIAITEGELKTVKEKTRKQPRDFRTP